MPSKETERPAWYGKGYSFFTNTACEYFPCHPVPEGTEFNCLFCYCPLYVLGRDCGGNFTYLETGARTAASASCPTGGRATAISSGAIRIFWA